MRTPPGSTNNKGGEYMAIDKKAEYNMKYAKEKLKRVPLDVQKEQYEQIKAAADASDQPVNAYIKQAVRSRMETEGFDWPEK